MKLNYVAMMALLTVSSSAFAVPVIIGTANVITMDAKKVVILPDGPKTQKAIVREGPDGKIKILGEGGEEMAALESIPADVQTVQFDEEVYASRRPRIYYQDGFAGYEGAPLGPPNVIHRHTRERIILREGVEIRERETVIDREYSDRHLRGLVEPGFVPQVLEDEFGH